MICKLQLAARLPALLPLPVAQKPSKNLPRRRLGNLINEFNATCDPLVTRLGLLDMLLDVTCDHSVALFETHGRRLHDERLRHLASIVVGDLNDGAIIYSGMR